MESSLSSQLTCLVFLCAAALLLLPLFTPVSASNVCICECCEGSGRCSRNNTKAFTIYDDCNSGCTKVPVTQRSRSGRGGGSRQPRSRPTCRLTRPLR